MKLILHSYCTQVTISCGFLCARKTVQSAKEKGITVCIPCNHFMNWSIQVLASRLRFAVTNKQRFLLVKSFRHATTHRVLWNPGISLGLCISEWVLEQVKCESMIKMKNLESIGYKKKDWRNWVIYLKKHLEATGKREELLAGTQTSRKKVQIRIKSTTTDGVVLEYLDSRSPDG